MVWAMLGAIDALSKSAENVQALTDAPLHIADDLKGIEL